MLGAWAFLVADQYGVEAGEHEECGGLAGEETADDRAGQRGIGLAAAFQGECPGIRAKKAARAVIVTGRTRIEAALRIACVGVSPSCRRSSWAKSVISTVFATLIPTTKMNPSNDCTLIADPVR